jgi:predicted TIM-barrel fold metal-dependent hydrolase
MVPIPSELDFFDCNVYLGRPMNRPAGSFGDFPATAEDLLRHLDRAGIRRALVWHVAQRDAGPDPGNGLLDQAIARHADRLAGTWTFLPFQTREMGDADTFFAAARKAGVRAFRVFPDLHRFLLRREAIGEVLDHLVASRVPLILRVGDVGWDNVYNLLAACPELTVILANMGAWNNDRYFRPLIERYPNVCIETSGYITDGGIEAFVASYGARRLLFGSGFPEVYLGSMMLAIAHAEIPAADKQAIAGGNLDRLLKEVRL